MGFRGSRVQIPPSRLSEDQALQRLSLWGFFFGCAPCCESCCESSPPGPLSVPERGNSHPSSHDALRRMQHYLPHCLGIGLLIRTKQRLLVLPARGFHHVTSRFLHRLSDPASPGLTKLARWIWKVHYNVARADKGQPSLYHTRRFSGRRISRGRNGGVLWRAWLKRWKCLYSLRPSGRSR
jgi:hypothetical protein